MAHHYLMGVFPDEHSLLRAFHRMKEEHMEVEDVFTPYPVHEILEKHGRKSRITIVGWFYGFFAALAVLAFLYFTAVVNWPLNYGGKPSVAFPSFLVVTIILTIFSITILSLATFSWRAGLWPGKEAVILHEKATDDKFVLVALSDRVDAGKFDALMKEAGALEVIDKTVEA
ncbi:MAG: DUF3341 domain-containing protein [Bacteroidales bacterium]